MPIGKFARACRLSVKALRHYDEEQLLRPAHVDERSGYRYYTREQVRDAVTIGMLRGLGFGIPIIRRFLAGTPAERATILQSEAQRIEREMAQRRFALDAIARFGSTGTLAPYEVGIRRVEPLQVAERCVVSPLPELPHARVVDMPGGEFATVMHVGPYEQLGLAYHALYAWAQEHGHEARGLVREIYVNDPANVRPEALQT